VIARDQLHLGAGGFGLLSGGFGCGAIVGALAIPRQLERRSLNVVVNWASIFWIGAIALVAAADFVALAIVAAAVAGAAWVSVLAGLSAGVQSSAPGWVRARAVGVNLVATQASLALGSALWGGVASTIGLRLALISSAVVMLVLLILIRRVRVAMGEEADVTPGARLPDLAIEVEPRPTDGPVLIQLEYRIEPSQRADFVRAIYALEPVRRRNGAIGWRVFRDLGEGGHFVERFIIGSWGEYVRLRTRMTAADHSLQDRVNSLQRRDVEIRISRLIGVNPERDAKDDEVR
jgi:MFS family permease